MYQSIIFSLITYKFLRSILYYVAIFLIRRLTRARIVRRKATLQRLNKAINYYRFQGRRRDDERPEASFFPIGKEKSRGRIFKNSALEIVRREACTNKSRFFILSWLFETCHCCFRISAPFQVVAVILILAATVSALIGHCYSDHRTLIACGLFLLSGK